MDITNFAKASGSYLNAKEIMANPTVPFFILNEGQLVTSEKFKTEKLELEGEYNKAPKILALSKTNVRTISEKLGTDTKKWISPQLVLETYKTKTSDGKLTDAINVKEIK